MDSYKTFEADLYSINGNTFDDIALKMFRHQAVNNPVYNHFITSLGIQPDKIHSLEAIPYLPIGFFKTHPVKTGVWQPQTEFRSSGTTAQVRSVHAVKDLDFYLKNSLCCFEAFFGDPLQYNFLALLPSYHETGQSSLLAMVDHLIRKSQSEASGFYLNDVSALLSDLQHLKTGSRRNILWGVTYALLDLAKREKPDLSSTLIIETGGMKGRGREITRGELHDTLRAGLNVTGIYSEYGMTELFSQCFTKGSERFYCPPWVKIIGRDLSDPLAKGLLSETAGINIIDLANWHSICFIETEDLGKVHPDGSFEVLGRMDNSDIRGCNLMVDG